MSSGTDSESQSDDGIESELRGLFDYNPPFLRPDPLAASHCQRLAPPLTFYDTHLDERLTLKKICVVPSLLRDLSSSLDNTIDLLEDLPDIDDADYVDDFPTKSRRQAHVGDMFKLMIDASEIAWFYRGTSYEFCGKVASTLALHPNGPSWDSSVLMWQQGLEWRTEGKFPAVDGSFVPQIRNIRGQLDIPKDLWECLDDAKKTILHEVLARFPKLAVWEVFALSEDANDILKDMERVPVLGTFSHARSSTTGYISPFQGSLSYSPDAPKPSWSIPLVSSTIEARSSSAGVDPTTNNKIMAADTNVDQTGEHLRRSTRTKNGSLTNGARPTIGSQSATTSKTKTDIKSLKDKVSKKRKIGKSTNNILPDPGGRWPSVTPSSAPKRAAEDEENSMATLFIQKIWTRAVSIDATFMVFHCGNFERIGFRHRETQTLYISELIDVPNCKDPAYGKIHVGLYLAILQDVIDRTTQICEKEKQTSKRRRQAGNEDQSSKRPRTRTHAAKERNDERERLQSSEVIKLEAGSRNLALVQLQYEKYNSPVPASFLRCGQSLTSGAEEDWKRTDVKDSYEPSEYLLLTLTSKIAEGGTGVAHNARLQLMTPDNKTWTHDVVVKFAFLLEQRERMQHEFDMYKHMSPSNIDGIPKVYGLFEDVENGHLALVMDSVGICLWTARTDKESFRISVSASERAEYLRIMSDIHRTGVRHHDLRGENLMIDEKTGKVAIIDFDRADIGSSVGARRRELRHLVELLDASYYPLSEEVASAATTEDSASKDKSDTRSKQASGSDTE